MEGDARSTTHPIQQPIADEAEARSAFDDITYKKGQSFIRMLENFLGEDVFRDGIRRYIAVHKYSNSTTADLWSALSEASGKPTDEIAAAWTEQPGFPVVKVRRDLDGKVSLRQERFTINFKNPTPLEWKIPLTYFVLGEKPANLLMTNKIDNLQNIPPERALKINVDGAGNYRVQYDPASWDLLLASLADLDAQERVNLLSDSWALVQADRGPISIYLGLINKLPHSTELAQWDQIINVFDFINRLLIGQPQREPFQQYARSMLRPVFEELGWEPKPDESPNVLNLRGSLIAILGDLQDQVVITACRERFQKYLNEPASLSPDLRQATIGVVGRFADESIWNKLHEFGLKTTNIAEKQTYYDALASARDPKLVQKTLEIALTEELSSSRAVFLVPKVARESDRPDLAWQFARQNMKALLAKIDALGINSYAPSLFTFFSEPARVDELKAYAKTSLPSSAAKEVAKAVDEVEFRSQFKRRLSSQIAAWIENQPARK